MENMRGDVTGNRGRLRQDDDLVERFCWIVKKPCIEVSLRINVKSNQCMLSFYMCIFIIIGMKYQ